MAKRKRTKGQTTIVSLRKQINQRFIIIHDNQYMVLKMFKNILLV
jgi:hypothetical protein